MLNTLPPSVPLPSSPIPPRRRGGQPSNRNALKHGLFARKNPTPLTHLSHSFTTSQSGLDRIPEFFDQAKLALQQQIALLVQASHIAVGLRASLASQRAIIRLMRLLGRLTKGADRCRQPQRHLEFIAAHALDLLRYDFDSSGITRDADSFREKTKKSDFYSSGDGFSPSISEHPSPFLTSHQWAVLEPMLPSPNSFFDLGRGRGWGRGRGRPLADPRLLLDAIFWKFAHHARWQDLPPAFPPMLTCRRYYRCLFLSGRLLTLYSALYKHLCDCGKVDLTAFVDQG